jgi:hypothetical protein
MTTEARRLSMTLASDGEAAAIQAFGLDRLALLVMVRGRA